MRIPEPLTPDQLYTKCDPEDLPPPGETDEVSDDLGQERALDAIRFGVGIRRHGYNIFVYGPPGTGKYPLARRQIEQAAAAMPVPPDWCYVHNFQETHKPRALQLPAGQGCRLRGDMETLIRELRATIPAAFEERGLPGPGSVPSVPVQPAAGSRVQRAAGARQGPERRPDPHPLGAGPCAHLQGRGRQPRGLSPVARRHAGEDPVRHRGAREGAAGDSQEGAPVGPRAARAVAGPEPGSGQPSGGTVDRGAEQGLRRPSRCHRLHRAGARRPAGERGGIPGAGADGATAGRTGRAAGAVLSPLPGQRHRGQRKARGRARGLRGSAHPRQRHRPHRADGAVRHPHHRLRSHQARRAACRPTAAI